jgi:hypothetical protein
MSAKTLQFLGLIAMSAVATAAWACGDKLAMIGGGVSFERVSQTAHPGRVVLLIAPDSPFSQAETELKLTDSLRRTGHSVRRVASEAELETALHQEGADVVVVYWTDAGSVNDRLAASTSGAPTVVPVVYHASASQLSDATAQSKCVAQVEKRRGRQLNETIDRAVEKRKSGQPLDCATARGTDQST